jgi:hypothetical protein
MKRAMGAAILMAAMMVLPGTLTVLAQDGQGSGERGGAFAGGQMVRGTVTAAAADHLTVKTDAGDVYQVAISSNTRVMKDRQPLKVTEIKVGDGAGAMGVLDAPTKTIHAVFVTIMSAEQMKKMKEDLGKVYITGKVTAIDDVRLTVMRPDGVSQVIEVDEGTSFKRGGRGMASMMNGSGPVGATGGRPDVAAGAESITLADIKVGDTVVGPGALKNGVFVPTQLGVMDAAAMGQRRRRAAEAGAAAPANSVAAPKVATPNE